MDIINQKVQHKEYGTGVIQDYIVRKNACDMISVYFEKSGEISKFQYPDAFKKHLFAIESEFQEHVERELNPQNNKTVTIEKSSMLQNNPVKDEEKKQQSYLNQTKNFLKKQNKKLFSVKDNITLSIENPKVLFAFVIAIMIIAIWLIASMLSSGNTISKSMTAVGKIYKADTKNESDIKYDSFIEFYGKDQFVLTNAGISSSVETERGTYSIKNNVLFLNYANGKNEEYNVLQQESNGFSLENKKTNELIHYAEIDEGMPYSDEETKASLVGKWSDCISIKNMTHPEMVNTYFQFNNDGIGSLYYYKFCDSFSDGKNKPVVYNIKDNILTIQADNKVLVHGKILFSRGGEIFSFYPEGNEEVTYYSKVEQIDASKLLIPDYYQEFNGCWVGENDLSTSLYNGRFAMTLCLDGATNTFYACYSDYDDALPKRVFSGTYYFTATEIILFDENNNVYGKYTWQKVEDVLCLNQTEGLLPNTRWEFKKGSSSLENLNDAIKDVTTLKNVLLSANILGEAETGIKSASEKALEIQEIQQKKSEQQYVGSRKSDKYHELGCLSVHQIKESNLIYFSSIEDAENQGYSPCGHCHPNVR